MIFSLVAMSALSQVSGGRPTLIVGISIDQLRNDYLDLLQSQFGNGGFKRLMQDGAKLETVVFDMARLDKATSTAVIYTGTYPNINGITGVKTYSEDSRRITPALNDPKYIGNATDETLSPMAIKVSTLSDVVRMDNNGIGDVYAIAPDAQQAIIMAGHAANGAFWISDKTGKWASSTFYKDYPTTISSQNMRRPLKARLDTLTWRPRLDISKYPDIPLHRTLYPFKYTFKGSDGIERFKSSALVNEEVTSVAISCINDMALGKRATIDMINIAYSAAPYAYATDNDSRIELQDKYIRLDHELERLFAAIEKNVGKNVCIFVTPTGYFDDLYATDPRFNIPTGEFSSKKAISLLNMYLMALYGNGSWVNAYFDEKVYLNEKLAKEKNISVEELRKVSGDFLRRMAGVDEAYTFDEILNNPTGETLQRLHRSITSQETADVFLQIAPGWKVRDDYNNGKVKQVNINAVSAPAFIIAPGVKTQKITSPIDASLLAPTVASIMRIRSPNGTRMMPLSLKD